MNIFIKIKNSIYNPEYYSEVITKPFSYSLKYYIIFALIFALAFTIITTIRFIPVVNLLSEKVPGISNYFPQDLTINIKDGKVSTNVQEPYFIKMPKDYENNDRIQPYMTNLDNIIVIDTKNEFDRKNFDSYKTFILLTSDSLVYINNDGQIIISPLSGIKDFTLNRGKIVDLIYKVMPFLVFIYPLVFVIAYMAGFMGVLIMLVYLLFGALLVWLTAKIKGVKISYGKSYQTGMHLMTSVIIITSILNIIPARITIPFLFTILLILSAVLNLRKNIQQPNMSAN